MTGVAQVLRWRPEPLLATATAFDVGGESVANTADAVRRSFDLDPTWSGVTRTSAGHRVDAEVTALHRFERTLVDLSDATREGHGRLSAVRDRIVGQIRTARSSGFNIGDDGAVAHPDPRRRADADYLTERITALLTEADAADTALSGRLTMLMRHLDGSGNVVPLPIGGYAEATEAGRLLDLMPPDVVERYWESLAPAQRRNLIDSVPEVVGNLNGIDFADRAEANTISIQRTLDAEVAAGRRDGAKARQLRALLRPAPDPLHPGRSVPRTFLGFRDVGDGRFIELVGDLTADATGAAVLVPGTGTGLHSVDVYRRRAANLSHASGAPVIVYADGPLPQKLIDADLSPIAGTASDAEPARRMAPGLVEFAAALDRQIDASGLDLKTTVIGHSYGGAVVGTAEQSGLRSDRVVYASSAGTGVEDRPWNNAEPHVQRYSLTPPGDPIQYWQQMGSSVHGGDPDTAPGVTRLDTGNYSDGTPVAGRSAHSGYLDDEGSGAMRAMAAVVAGRCPPPYIERAPDIDAAQDALDVVGGWIEEGLSLVTPGR